MIRNDSEINIIDKEKVFLECAVTLSRLSTCKRLKVGALIIDLNTKEIISYGYNGNYRGGPNTCDSVKPGQCGCVHAENNALIKNGDKRGMALFVSTTPCIDCAKLIINSGIKSVYYYKEYRIKEGKQILEKVGIKVEKIVL